jgi:hypothetical protein
MRTWLDEVIAGVSAFVEDGAVQCMPCFASAGELGRHQSSDPDEVAGSGDQVTSQLGPRQAAKARPTEATHGLHPAKDLLYSLAEAFAQAVAGVACRSTIDGTPPPTRVLRYMGRHTTLTHFWVSLFLSPANVERRFAWIRRQISRVGACETS